MDDNLDIDDMYIEIDGARYVKVGNKYQQYLKAGPNDYRYSGREVDLNINELALYK